MYVDDAGLPPRFDIIDVCEVAYDDACWHAYLGTFAHEAPGYLEMFGSHLCELAGADKTEYRAAVTRDPRSAVDLLVEAGGLRVDFDQHARSLEAQGVSLQVLHGGMWKIEGGNVNDRLAELCAPHERLQFWVGLSLRDTKGALDELKRGHRELGARGASVVPFLDGVDIVDPAHLPVFTYLEEQGLPFWIHCGNNFAATRPLDSCSWHHIDRIASRHPALTVIVGHGGWPWIAEIAAVAQRHRNVYIDSSTHRATAMARIGSGWEPILARADTTLRHKLLFGSTTWTAGQTTRSLADEFSALDIGDRARAAWLGGNARRILTNTPAA